MTLITDVFDPDKIEELINKEHQNYEHDMEVSEDQEEEEDDEEAEEESDDDESEGGDEDDEEWAEDEAAETDEGTDLFSLKKKLLAVAGSIDVSTDTDTM